MLPRIGREPILSRLKYTLTKNSAQTRASPAASHPETPRRSCIGISILVAAPVRAWIPPVATASPPRLHETVAAFGGLIEFPSVAIPVGARFMARLVPARTA